MDPASESLYNARQQLVSALGEKEKQYFIYMKLWFRMVYTKEQFDSKARQLLEPSQIHYHNNFMVSLLRKCQGLAEEPIKTEISRSSGSLKKAKPYMTISAECLEEKFKKFKEKYKMDKDKNVTFEPMEFLEIPTVTRNLSKSPLGEASHRLCSQDSYLPDQSLIFSRMLLGAWDVGLKGVEDLAAECLAMAVQVFLKNIISSVIAQKKGFKMKDNRIIHSVGRPVPCPLVTVENLKFQMRKQNIKEDSDTPSESYNVPKIESEEKKFEEKKRFTYEDLIHEKMSAEGAGSTSVPGVITTFDLRDTLKRYPSLIRSPKVYAISMQRVMLAVSHLSHEELEVMRVLQNHEEDYVEPTFDI